MKNSKHHIINTGGKDLILYFSIDFEPVELWLNYDILKSIAMEDRSNYLNVHSFNMFFWQKIFDFCCETLKKEKRDIFSHKLHDKLNPCNDMCYEYIGRSEAYHWLYFSLTKTHYFNKYYHWRELILQGNEVDEKRIKYQQHYDKVYQYLERQGLMIGDAYYEPTNKMINILTKKLIRHENNKRTIRSSV